MGQSGSFGVQNVCFSPAFASFGADDPPHDTNRRGAGHDFQVLHLEAARHGGHSRGSNRFTHCLIQQGGYDAAVQAAGVSAEIGRDNRFAHDCPILVNQELELEAVWI